MSFIEPLIYNRQLLEKEVVVKPVFTEAPIAPTTPTRSYIAHAPLSFKATEFMARCLKAYRQACAVAAKSLDISDGL